MAQKRKNQKKKMLIKKSIKKAKWRKNNGKRKEKANSKIKRRICKKRTDKNNPLKKA